MNFITYFSKLRNEFADTIDGEPETFCASNDFNPMDTIFEEMDQPISIQEVESAIRSLTHYQTANFRLFQTERVCRRQFQIDENGRKLSKRVENTVGKGEIARYEQFLLFPQCFQKVCLPRASKGVIEWEWVKTQ